MIEDADGKNPVQHLSFYSTNISIISISNKKRGASLVVAVPYIWNMCQEQYLLNIHGESLK